MSFCQSLEHKTEHLFTTNFDFLDGLQNMLYDWTECFKNVSNCLYNNINSYLETSGGQNFNLCLNVVHFFNTSVN